MSLEAGRTYTKMRQRRYRSFGYLPSSWILRRAGRTTVIVMVEDLAQMNKVLWFLPHHEDQTGPQLRSIDRMENRCAGTPRFLPFLGSACLRASIAIDTRAL